MVKGIATATEVATIGVVYCFVVGSMLRESTMWRRLPAMLAETASLSGSILLIVGGATAMAWGLTQSGFADDLASAIINLPGGSMTFLGVSIVAFLVLGSLLEGIPAIVVFGPLLFLPRVSSGSMTSTMRSWSSPRWGSGCSPRHSASGTTSPAQSAESTRK